MFDFEALGPTATEADEGQRVASSVVERLWALSDVHTDAKENLAFIERLDSKAYIHDALILAGDVSDDLSIVRRTLRGLRAKFARVFFVPGNHDLWVTRQKAADGCANSLQKLTVLEALCKEEGVDTEPQCLAVPGRSISHLWIVPLLSWHSFAFDVEPDIDERWKGIPKAETVCSDFRLCKWPAPLDPCTNSVAERLDVLNDERLEGTREPERSRVAALFEGRREPGQAVVSFSHFLPRIELLPEKRYLYFPCLAKFVGSPELGRRVSRLQPDVHVFGHTHFGWDQDIDGVRYLSPPVGMPRERDIRMSTISTGDLLKATGKEDLPVHPVLVWDQHAGFAERYDAGWSGFYKEYAREPEQVLVLPDYVASMYEWDEKRNGPKSKVIGWEGRTPAWKFGPAWSQGRKRHY